MAARAKRKTRLAEDGKRWHGESKTPLAEDGKRWHSATLPWWMDPASREDAAVMVLIVVGAHPNAERNDRATAYGLRERLLGMLRSRLAPDRVPEVLVCSDVWYLNDESMRRSPSISVGAPGVNALTAYLASRLPSAFVIDDVLMVQFDPSAEGAMVACWGTTPSDTVRATEIFVERYGRDFLAAVVGV